MKSPLKLMYCLPIVLMIGLLFQAQAQQDVSILEELAKEEQDAVNALVLYPEDTRLAILDATLYPEALIKMESIQSRTSAAFQAILENYPKATQEKIWDLTRYPDLIHRLVSNESGSEALIEEIILDYPEVIHQRIRQVYYDHYNVLYEIDQLGLATEVAFAKTLDQYPPKTRASLQKLTALPEVLTILTENIRLTILVGDLYRNDPAMVLQKADSLNLVAARQNAEELENWKNSIQQNPDVQDELRASAEQFSDEYGYDDEEYFEDENDDLYYNGERTERVVHHYYHHHYPYWFGYPYWYEYPRWRMYPYWYDWGFYFGPRRTIVVIGLPSFHFTHWYFYHPHHHHHWPHLSAHFVNHYYGHRAYGSSITTSVTVWRNNNRAVISDEWMRDDGRMANRFKEYGKFESERIKYNRKKPHKALSQKEYIQRKSRSYPSLAKSQKESVRNKTNQIEFKKTVPPKEKVQKVPVREKTKRESIYTRKKKTTKSPKVDKGRIYHQNKWEKTKATRNKTKKPSAPRVKPKTKTKPNFKPKVRKPSTKTTIKRKN